MSVPNSRSATPENGEDDEKYPQFPVLHLCSDRIEAMGVYLLDQPDLILIYVGRNVSVQFCEDVLGVQSFLALHEMVFNSLILYNLYNNY